MRNSALLCLTVLLAACGSQESAPPPQPVEQQELTHDQVIQAWHQLALAGADRIDAGTATIIAQKLLEDGPEGLRPILDALGDKDGNPVEKVLAVISLTPILMNEKSPELVAVLEESFLESTEPDAETATRACAAHLLAYLDTEAANARINALLDDSDHHVQKAATLAAIQQGRFPEAYNRIESLWDDEATTAQDRDQFVLVLPETSEYNDIRAEAILNDDIAFETRMMALNVLGRVGDESVYDALAQCAEEAPEASIRDLAEKALASLKEMGGGAGVMPLEVIVDGDATPMPLEVIVDDDDAVSVNEAS